MYHKKRFSLALAVFVALLLTAALAPVAAAQTPPPAIAPGGGGGENQGSTNPPPGDTTSPPPTNGKNGNGGKGGNGSTNPPPTNGNGGNGNGDMMKPMAPVNWPPPNAIVHHAATPIQISSLAGGLQVYLIHPDGSATNGPLLASLSGLAEMHPEGDPVQLYEGVNPGSGKPVTIEYLPAEMKLRVSTFYADKPPHDFDKAYIFTVDADHSVKHERW